MKRMNKRGAKRKIENKGGTAKSKDKDVPFELLAASFCCCSSFFFSGIHNSISSCVREEFLSGSGPFDRTANQLTSQRMWEKVI